MIEKNPRNESAIYSFAVKESNNPAFIKGISNRDEREYWEMAVKMALC
jgi:hypothetical protein